MNDTGSGGQVSVLLEGNLAGLGNNGDLLLLESLDDLGAGIGNHDVLELLSGLLLEGLLEGLDVLLDLLALLAQLLQVGSFGLGDAEDDGLLLLVLLD